MRILRLGIENWRNFRTATVRFGTRTFIAGPTAAGKTNLLDALCFLGELAGPERGLAGAAAARGGISRIRCLSARQRSDIVLEVDAGDGEGVPEWSYRLHLGEDRRGRPAVRRETVRRGGERVLDRPDPTDLEHPDRLGETHMEQVGARRAFRELAELLASVRYVHMVPQQMRARTHPTGAGDAEHDPWGGRFLERLAAAPARSVATRLRRIEQALGMAVPQLAELAVQRDRSGLPHLAGRFSHWRPYAGWQREDQFADGVLRLVGLLWAAQDGAGPLLLEEPELALHAEVVRAFPRMLSTVMRRRRRQAMITTHSPDLLADRGIRADETIVLAPGAEGTRVISAAEQAEILPALRAGMSVRDVARAATAERSGQLPLFKGS